MSFWRKIRGRRVTRVTSLSIFAPLTSWSCQPHSWRTRCQGFWTASTRSACIPFITTSLKRDCGCTACRTIFRNGLRKKSVCPRRATPLSTSIFTPIPWRVCGGRLPVPSSRCGSRTAREHESQRREQYDRSYTAPHRVRKGRRGNAFVRNYHASGSAPERRAPASGECHDASAAATTAAFRRLQKHHWAGADRCLAFSGKGSKRKIHQDGQLHCRRRRRGRDAEPSCAAAFGAGSAHPLGRYYWRQRLFRSHQGVSQRPAGQRLRADESRAGNIPDVQRAEPRADAVR